MYKINIKTPYKDRNNVFINGKPDIKKLSQQDYKTFISVLEMEIRNYYKDKKTDTIQRKDIPP